MIIQIRHKASFRSGALRSLSHKSNRDFYRREGFLPLEVFPLYWNEENP